MISFNTAIIPNNPRAACLIMAVFEGRQLYGKPEQLDADSYQHITRILAQGDLEGKLGETLLIHLPPQDTVKRILLVGGGDIASFTSAAYKKVVGAMAAVLTKANISDAICYLPLLPLTDADYYSKVRQAVAAIQNGVYQFTACKSLPDHTPIALQQLTFAAEAPADIAQGERAILHAQAIAQGVEWTKTLGNLPANICTPTYVAEQAQAFARQYSSQIETTVLEESDMEALGMGALLSVARGSREPAKLIIVHYRGVPSNTGQDERPVVLVGKGVTFDSGGISIKPSPAMDEMKFDMCGAASVLGAIKAAAVLALPLNIVGILPMTENMPGGQATKPGDIVTSMSGQTIEILNTDAEGRLILSDALTYSERFNPDVVIDIATLTGAIIMTLGSTASGLMSSDSLLSDELIKSGEYTGDRVWPLPLWDDYQELLTSNFADIPNISEGPGAKSITAACFLSRFTKNMRWAHLDIAGTAWKSGREKGATGRPVPLLVQFLLNRCTS